MNKKKNPKVKGITMASIRKENKRIKMGSELDSVENRIDNLFAQLDATITLLDNVKNAMIGDPGTYDSEDIAEVDALITKINDKYNPIGMG